MTSKVPPATEYNELLTKKTWRQGCVIFGERKNKEQNGKTPLTGLLILRNGAISHNRPQIASDRTIHKKSHNSQKIA